LADDDAAATATCANDRRCWLKFDHDGAFALPLWQALKMQDWKNDASE